MHRRTILGKGLAIVCVCMCDREAGYEFRCGTEPEFRGELDTEENSQNVSGRKWCSSCDSGGKITSPLGRQRGEDVQPAVGLRCQDRAEQRVLYRREGRDSGAEAGHDCRVESWYKDAAPLVALWANNYMWAAAGCQYSADRRGAILKNLSKRQVKRHHCGKATQASEMKHDGQEGGRNYFYLQRDNAFLAKETFWAMPSFPTETPDRSRTLAACDQLQTWQVHGQQIIQGQSQL